MCVCVHVRYLLISLFSPFFPSSICYIVFSLMDGFLLHKDDFNSQHVPRISDQRQLRQLEQEALEQERKQKAAQAGQASPSTSPSKPCSSPSSSNGIRRRWSRSSSLLSVTVSDHKHGQPRGGARQASNGREDRKEQAGGYQSSKIVPQSVQGTQDAKLQDRFQAEGCTASVMLKYNGDKRESIIVVRGV